MKKIAIITPFLAQGGLEKVAVTGAEYLKNYFDTTLIVFDTFKVDYPYSGIMLDLKIPLYGLSPLKKVVNLSKIFSTLKKLQKSEQYDLVIIHGELANIAAIFDIFPKKVVVIHENRFAKKPFLLKNTIFNLFARRLYRSKSTKKIITVSEGIREVFIEKFHLHPKSIQTIYNPYEINEIIRLSALEIDGMYKKLFDNYDVLLMAARLTEAKGQKLFMNIFKGYLEKNSEAKLVLLGDGEMREDLISYSKSLGLKTYSNFDKDKYSDDYNVFFLGFDKNPYKYMKSSKLFVMSSLWEGFGNTLVESMACGTPVVSTDCKSGPKEIIAPDVKNDISTLHFGEYGALLPRSDLNVDKNHELWMKALDALILDKKTYENYINKGFSRAEDFDKSIIMPVWKELVESILDKDNKC